MQVIGEEIQEGLTQDNIDKNQAIESEYANFKIIPICENACKFTRSFKLVGYDLCNMVKAHVRSVTYST